MTRGMRMRERKNRFPEQGEGEGVVRGVEGYLTFCWLEDEVRGDRCARIAIFPMLSLNSRWFERGWRWESVGVIIGEK